jgi:hypothetical protein
MFAFTGYIFIIFGLMTKPPFITRLNWRLILLNIAAYWFSAYGFNLLSTLYDLESFRYLVKIQEHHISYKDLPENFSHNIESLFRETVSATFGGELVAFIISLLIAFKKRWFWLNSFIPLLVTFLLIRFHISGWNWLKHIFLKPGHLFAYPSAGYFIANGSVLLILGALCLFFSTKLNFPVRTETPTENPISDATLPPAEEPC